MKGQKSLTNISDKLAEMRETLIVRNSEKVYLYWRLSDDKRRSESGQALHEEIRSIESAIDYIDSAISELSNA